MTGLARTAAGYVVIAALLIFSTSVTAVVLMRGLGASQMSIYSDDWNDLSMFRDELERNGYEVAHVAASPTYLNEVEDPEKTLFVVAGMEREYHWTELFAISVFIQRGGSVLIADDFGFGNSFFEDFSYFAEEDMVGDMLVESDHFDTGIEYRLSDRPVLDHTYETDPRLVKLYTDTTPTYELILNEPSAFVKVDRNTGYRDHVSMKDLYAHTSPGSWIDIDGNGSRDIGETGGPFEVAMSFSKGGGAGTLYLVSDPSIFMNEMWELADNDDFTIFLVRESLPEGGCVVFDESVHRTEAWPLEAARGYYWSLSLLTHSCLLGGLIVSVCLIVLIAIAVKGTMKKRYAKHGDMLGKRMLHTYLRFELGNEDYHWMITVLLEKVRCSYDITYRDFQSLSHSEIDAMIDDPYIVESMQSAVSSKGMSGEELRAFAERIISWERQPVTMTVSGAAGADEKYVDNGAENDGENGGENGGGYDAERTG